MAIVRPLLLLASSLLAYAAADSIYLLGDQGESCAAACGRNGRECNPSVPTNNSADIFKQLGVSCRADTRPWWAMDQPNVVTDPEDPNFGDCLGWTDVPANVLCQGSFHAVRRLCFCGRDNTNDTFFGTGYSGGEVSTNETTLFAHVLSPGSTGVIDHFWTTAPPAVLDGVIFRFYVDGETAPSIEFKAGLACGVGFLDSFAPWGTKWFGVGAGNSKGTAYSLNFNMPFARSIRFTVQHESGTFGGFYTIVRGMRNKQVNIGGVVLPPTARLWLQKTQRTVQPLEFVAVTNITSGPGMHFMHTIQVASVSQNFIEGCYRAYTQASPSFPGIVLSTGTEDYFDSGWTFNAGVFHSAVSGCTHIKADGNYLELSAYRFHEQDPLVFDNGFSLVWRNGDLYDPHSGLKCYSEKDGQKVGSPAVSNITVYGWIYTW